MEYRVVAIKVENRQVVAVKVQDILTEYGCVIKVRLGLHDAGSDKCSPSGLVLLEVVADNPKVDEMLSALNRLEGVEAKELII